MRAKELKAFLNKLPDDTEILIRCQVHEHPPMCAKETVEIESVTPQLNDTVHRIMFNANKAIRVTSFQPNPTDLVSCKECVRANRILTCQKKERSCEDCKATCECKDCGHYNVDSMEPFSNRPKYERDPLTKNSTSNQK